MPASRRLGWAGGVFEAHHRARLGGKVDLGRIAEGTVDPGLLARARIVWQSRVASEFRSIQIMNRFATEVMNSGDPLDVYAWALDLVADEVRHTELCAEVCRYLGIEPHLPEPVALQEGPEFLAQPFPVRALITAISMVGINETISVGFISDLAERCTDSQVKRVIDATLADEEEHGGSGFAYIATSLARFDGESRAHFRTVVAHALAPHEAHARAALADVPPERRTLEACPEPELAHLGLLSPARQALLYQCTRDAVLRPRLGELDLL